MHIDEMLHKGCIVEFAWQGVGPFRVLALGGQWLGKLVASAWQARGKLVASGPFFWQALVLPFWGSKNVRVFNVSGFGNPVKEGAASAAISLNANNEKEFQKM